MYIVSERMRSDTVRCPEQVGVNGSIPQPLKEREKQTRLIIVAETVFVRGFWLVSRVLLGKAAPTLLSHFIFGPSCDSSNAAQETKS
ncbi:hypothetical protein CEXT_100221 [Caerostris extrusa]|uniref:Uncharacterized protein n=1 Tax=Caerostris extrusa TaxID=172846 RepID=A0AAV4PBF7_CAEEX|nr:hypothetical protein CEXT_100221 [Caerostris extrusa]